MSFNGFRTVDEWCQIKGIEIVDNDGFSGYPWFGYTEEMFDNRIAKCTVRHLRKAPQVIDGVVMAVGSNAKPENVGRGERTALSPQDISPGSVIAFHMDGCERRGTVHYCLRDGTYFVMTQDSGGLMTYTVRFEDITSCTNKPLLTQSVAVPRLHELQPLDDILFVHGGDLHAGKIISIESNHGLFRVNCGGVLLSILADQVKGIPLRG